MKQRAAGGNDGDRIESMTSYQISDLSIDAYLLEEQSCQMSSRSVICMLELEKSNICCCVVIVEIDLIII